MPRLKLIEDTVSVHRTTKVRQRDDRECWDPFSKDASSLAAFDFDGASSEESTHLLPPSVVNQSRQAHECSLLVRILGHIASTKLLDNKPSGSSTSWPSVGASRRIKRTSSSRAKSAMAACSYNDSIVSTEITDVHAMEGVLNQRASPASIDTSKTSQRLALAGGSEPHMSLSTTGCGGVGRLFQFGLDFLVVGLGNGVVPDCPKRSGNHQSRQNANDKAQGHHHGLWLDYACSGRALNEA